jgi:hypothetical protein
VTASVPASQGEKTDEGTMMLKSTPESNPVAVAELPETQTLTPATTKEATDILINCRNRFLRTMKIERFLVRPYLDRCSPRGPAHLNVDVFVFAMSSMSLVSLEGLWLLMADILLKNE